MVTYSTEQLDLFGDYPDDVVISCENVYKIYKTHELEVVALSGVSLQILEGKIMCVVGPSGSGKTTLTNIIGGITKATVGKVYWANLRSDITKIGERVLTEARRNFIGFVFQINNLLPHLNAWQNIELAARIAGVPKSVRQDRVDRLIKLVGLEERRHNKATTLSGGERSRVAIASALVNLIETEGKGLVLCDEPTGDLDPETAERILDLFQELNETLGTSFFIVTHSQQVASKADVTVEIRDGIISGFHQAGIDLDTLDDTRVVKLDNNYRLPMPTDLLEAAGNPTQFRISFEDGRFILVPQLEDVVDTMRIQRTRTCRVCGNEIPQGKFICPNCGSTI
ncbi:MAG: ATP-binding cassette domain-containing protein [Candidatus Thorarchaeota archaeon]|nr:MAG: ATP-binding cassette domain-containing protein [Candidatus Thorarchaeota archaeon]